MKKFRYILALLFLTEVAVVNLHIVIAIAIKEEFPLFMYILMPAIVLACIVILYILKPVIEWITGDL